MQIISLKMYSNENDCIIHVSPPASWILQINNVKSNIYYNYVIISCNNKKMYISIPNFDITFYELKNLINKKLDYSNEQIQLYYDNNIVNESIKLSDYNISCKSIIYVYIKNNDDFIINIKI